MHELQLKNGYDFGEVASSLQKAIRRANEADALYWAVELDISGFGEYLWKRLRVMSSEDIGLAEPMMPSAIRALYDSWSELHKKKDPGERLFIIHAVLLLVRARKSRLVDNCLIASYGNHPAGKAIPDYALDKHTLKGKKLGRGFNHFFEVGARLENHAEQEGEKEYGEVARRLVSSNSIASCGSNQAADEG
ncbi:MAG: hypothetical protein HY673_09080 [Chloroflexi bacterium]|nr:hypothetical protein [Chloroflexota bacterium]